MRMDKPAALKACLVLGQARLWDPRRARSEMYTPCNESDDEADDGNDEEPYERQDGTDDQRSSRDSRIVEAALRYEVLHNLAGHCDHGRNDEDGPSHRRLLGQGPNENRNPDQHQTRDRRGHDPDQTHPDGERDHQVPKGIQSQPPSVGVGRCESMVFLTTADRSHR